MNTEVHDQWIGDHRISVVIKGGEVEAVCVGNTYLPIDDWKTVAQLVEDALNGYFDTGDEDE